MGSVRFGGGVVEIVGSVGGNTFARGPHGPYVRARVTPVNPNSTEQQVVRGLFSTAASAWATISQANRDAWELYASNTPTENKLGEQTFLSGYNWFCCCNAARRRASELVHIDPGPTTFGRPNMPTDLVLSATADSTAISMAYNNADPWAIIDDGALFWFLSQPRAAARNYLGPPYRHADYELGDTVTPPTSPKVGVNPFGVVTTEMAQDFYAFCVLPDGRISSRFEGSVVIA